MLKSNKIYVMLCYVMLCYVIKKLNIKHVNDIVNTILLTNLIK